MIEQLSKCCQRPLRVGGGDRMDTTHFYVCSGCGKPTDPEPTIPAIAFGPLGRPPDAELRFWRLIDERETDVDGWESITLACGHNFATPKPIPDTQEYAYCAECLHLATRIGTERCSAQELV